VFLAVLMPQVANNSGHSYRTYHPEDLFRPGHARDAGR